MPGSAKMIPKKPGRSQPPRRCKNDSRRVLPSIQGQRTSYHVESEAVQNQGKGQGKCGGCGQPAARRTSQWGVEYYCCYFGSCDDARCSLKYKELEGAPVIASHGGSKWP